MLPDAVFALNSGIHYYSSWAPTLESLLRKPSGPDVGVDAPFVVTAWAQHEALVVSQVLRDAGGVELRDHGLQLQANPFSSLAPQQVKDDHGATNFANRYIMGFSRQGWRSNSPKLKRACHADSAEDADRNKKIKS